MDNPHDIVAETRPDAPAAEVSPNRPSSLDPRPRAEQAKPAGGAAAPKPRRKWLRPLLFALLPIALVAGAYLYVTGGAVMSTENAYVQADMVGVSNDVSGMVEVVLVSENQKVARGDVLFKLDDGPFRFALEHANAQLGIVRDDLEAMKASYRTMQEQLQQAQTDIDFYTTAFKRQQQLVERNFASQAAFDAAQHDLQNARQKQASLKEQLAGIAANLDGKPDAPIEDYPRYRQAVADRDEAARQLAHTVVRAPMSGVATNVPSLQRGQYLASGTSAFSIVADDHVWVLANPKETELTNVKPGQPVEISIDTYPDETWHGVVDSISPASASSFSLLPAENSSGNWVKVVQRIPMRVRIDTPPGKPVLRMGMSVVVDVDTGRARGLPSALSRWFGWSSHG